MRKTYAVIPVLMSFVFFGFTMTPIFSESFEFRGKTIEEGTQCAEWFIDYQLSKPYDIFVKAPSLMKIDKFC